MTICPTIIRAILDAAEASGEWLSEAEFRARVLRHAAALQAMRSA